MEYLILLASFVVLSYSGNFLVKSGVALARHLRISTLVVGLVIISFGTSAPEFVISFEAALVGHPDISIGNIIGSNISNIALVLGLTAIILPLVVNKNSVKIYCPIMIIASIVFYLTILNNVIEFWEGIIFIVLVVGFVVLSIYYSRKETQLKNVDTKQGISASEEKLKKPQLSLFVSIILLIFSTAGIIISAFYLVKSASEIARNFGISERVISVTVIAFGSSVPELATSVIAVIKKQADISIGNIIGSNIFNILGILGITSIVKNIRVDNFQIFNLDFVWLIGVSFLLFFFILPLKGGLLTRWKGAVLLFLYIIYIYLVVCGYSF